MSEPPSPAGQRRLRAADTDREQAAEVLRQAAADGRLSFAELDQRLTQAYRAKTYAELAEVTSDLPSTGHTAAVAGQAAHSPDAPAGHAPGLSIAVMSGARKTGHWRVPDLYRAVAIMGGIELDLRSAEFTGPEATIQVFCLMGGVSITVPPDMLVDVSGVAFMGGFDHRATGPGEPGAPRLRVTGFAMMGGVEVKRKPRRELER